jgi:hypothetical protein
MKQRRSSTASVPRTIEEPPDAAEDDDEPERREQADDATVYIEQVDEHKRHDEDQCDLDGVEQARTRVSTRTIRVVKNPEVVAGGPTEALETTHGVLFIPDDMRSGSSMTKTLGHPLHQDRPKQVVPFEVLSFPLDRSQRYIDVQVESGTCVGSDERSPEQRFDRAVVSITRRAYVVSLLEDDDLGPEELCFGVGVGYERRIRLPGPIGQRAIVSLDGRWNSAVVLPPLTRRDTRTLARRYHYTLWLASLCDGTSRASHATGASRRSGLGACLRRRTEPDRRAGVGSRAVAVRGSRCPVSWPDDGRRDCIAVASRHEDR